MRRILLVMGLVSAGLPLRVAAQTTGGSILRGAELESRVDEYVERYLATGNFTGAILVGRGVEVPLNKGYGMANHELQVPNTADTVFHLASVSKSFTAAAIG